VAPACYSETFPAQSLHVLRAPDCIVMALQINTAPQTAPRAARHFHHMIQKTPQHAKPIPQTLCALDDKATQPTPRAARPLGAADASVLPTNPHNPEEGAQKQLCPPTNPLAVQGRDALTAAAASAAPANVAAPPAASPASPSAAPPAQ
jgi:hypothetical protein